MIHNFHHILPAIHGIPAVHGGRNKESFCAILIRSEIAYDIHFFTHKVANIAFAEAADKDKKTVVLSKDTADWLDRHITTALSKVRKDISFAVPRQSTMATNEILDSPHQFALTLVFDNEWTGDPQTLCDNIHDYVVKQCIADWSQYALNTRYAEFQTIADDALREVHDIACSYIVPPTTTFI